MKRKAFFILALCTIAAAARSQVDIKHLGKNGATVKSNKNLITVEWPVSNARLGRVVLDLDNTKPLFQNILMGNKNSFKSIARGLDPVFILREGKRKLSPSSGGWDVFFDKVPNSPFTTNLVAFNKKSGVVKTEGASTVVQIHKVQSGNFSGHLEITFYNGSPLLISPR